MMKISTGVKSLDAVIEGGFWEGTLNLVVGKRGSGRSLFAHRIAENAASGGHRFLYMSEDSDYPSGGSSVIGAKYTLSQVEQHLTSRTKVLILDSGLVFTQGWEESSQKRRHLDDVADAALRLTQKRDLVTVMVLRLNGHAPDGDDVLGHIAYSFGPAQLAHAIVRPVRDDAKNLGAILVKSPTATETGGWYF